MEELKIIFKQKVFLYQAQAYHCGEPSRFSKEKLHPRASEFKIVTDQLH
jgi:hypothetical protein